MAVFALTYSDTWGHLSYIQNTQENDMSEIVWGCNWWGSLRPPSGQEVMSALGLKWKEWGPAVQEEGSIAQVQREERWHSRLPAFMVGCRWILSEVGGEGSWAQVLKGLGPLYSELLRLYSPSTRGQWSYSSFPALVGCLF